MAASLAVQLCLRGGEFLFDRKRAHLVLRRNQVDVNEEGEGAITLADTKCDQRKLGQAVPVAETGQRDAPARIVKMLTQGPFDPLRPLLAWETGVPLERREWLSGTLALLQRAGIDTDGISSVSPRKGGATDGRECRLEPLHRRARGRWTSETNLVYEHVSLDSMREAQRRVAAHPSSQAARAGRRIGFFNPDGVFYRRESVAEVRSQLLRR